MSNDSSLSLQASSRVLILSMRNFDFWPSRNFLFELEYSVCNFDRVDVFTPNFSPTIFNKITRKLSRSTFNATGKVPFISQISNQVSLEQEYDLFLFICEFPEELYYLNSIKDWRKKCRQAVCWLDEIFVKDINKFKSQLTTLKNFDHVFMNLNSSREKVADIIQHPCSYLPPGIDAIEFCPYPLQPQRSIDVCSLGRRPTSIHTSLLNLASQDNFFYMYDTMYSKIRDYNAHRSLYREIIKRSRYFIAYKAYFANLKSEGIEQEELNVRFFEGAAGGAIILGTPPKCEAFNQNFDWSDAVISLPQDSTNVGEIIAHLDAQPERLNKIRTDNVVNCLLRHDWVYRWGQILDKVGLNHTPEMVQRRACLQSLAAVVLEKSS